MERKRLFSLVAALIALVLAVSPASGVQFGDPDGDDHRYVGLVIFYDDSTNKLPLWRCTGALVSSTVLLTAGHCTGLDPDTNTTPQFAQAWFEPGPIPLAEGWTSGTACSSGSFDGYPCTGGYVGVPHPHPEWNGYLTVPNTHDVGVVEFRTPIYLSKYGTLAGADYLDRMATKRGKQNVQFTVVGYGLQSVKPVESSVRERMAGTVSLVDLRSALNDGYNIQLSSAPGKGVGPGGTCFGDSGGPVLHRNAAGAEVVVAVNSFVLNENCRGAGFGYRVDTKDAREFLDEYLTLPE